jgi:hypothetical protein
MNKPLYLFSQRFSERGKNGSSLNYNSKVLNYAYEAVLMIRKQLNITLLGKKLYPGPILSVSKMKNN